MGGVINLLDFPIANETQDSVVRGWHALRFVIPVNVDVLMKLHRDREFREAVQARARSVTLVNDSRVLMFASRIFFGQRFLARVSGSDLLPALCGADGPSDVRVFLLGGVGGTAIRAMRKLNARAGRRAVVGAQSPSLGFERNHAECEALVATVNASGANVLAVGVGAPKQELWMLRHADEMPGIHLLVGVGAAIDFAAGVKKRAPRWVSESGLEWLYRLVHEPRRLSRRYLLDGPPVFWLLLKQRFAANPYKR